MATINITIQVDADVAKTFAGASLEDQQKIQLLLSLRLQDLVASSTRPLRTIMDDVGAKATARGMTPETLETLLHEQ
jgi:hypothetical protein